MPIFAPQEKHFPRKQTQLTTGISSQMRSLFPHSVQCDGGQTIDSLLRYRSETTLRKLPIKSPRIALKIVQSLRGT